MEARMRKSVAERKRIIQKYLEYFRYVWVHKWEVLRECAKKGLIWRGLAHDLSKFLPSEFFAYANFYFGTDEDRAAWSQKFNKAWLLHTHRNKHHWEHWVLFCVGRGAKLVEMPNRYRKEMFCEWVAVGRDTFVDWFRKNFREMYFHPKTKQAVMKEYYARTEK
jgi:hypothetical protein